MSRDTFPTYQICGKFDGSKPAGRWLQQLQCDLEPHYVEITPDIFFNAITILFTDKAENWLDSLSQFTKIIDLEEKPKTSDVEEFKLAFKRQYPRKTPEVSNTNIQEDIQNLKQEEKETLVAYHERAQELLSRSNGRDDSSNTIKPLSILERTILSIIIKSFVRGIRDDEVRSMILMKSTILSGSLQGAFERTKKAVATIVQREEIERERMERRELEHFRSQYLVQWGQPLGAALAEMDNQQRNNRPLQPYSTNEQRNTSQFIGPEIQRNVAISVPQHVSPINQRPAQPLMPHQQQRIENGIQRQPASGQGSQYQENTSRSNAPHGAKRERVDRTQAVSDENNTNRGEIGKRLDNTPPRHLSRNPFVNGSREYRREVGVLCIRCGQPGHRSPECVEIPLEGWEQRYLKDIIFRKNNSSFAGISANYSGLRYRDLDHSKWRNVDLENQSCRHMHQSKHENPYYQEDGQDMTLEQFSGESFRNEGTNHNTQSMSVILSIDNKEDKENFDKVKKRVRFNKPINDELVTLDAFLNLGDPRKRARPMDIENLLNREEQDAKIRKKEIKRGRRAARQLREIVGRYGMGAIDYKKIAQEIRVELSLMDLFQISPDLSKAFRNLSTRVNEKYVREEIKKEVPKSFEKKKRSTDGSEVLLGRAAGPRMVQEQKAFRVPIVIKTMKDGKPVRVTMPLGVAQADQGSDMIIVTVGFLKKLGIPARGLAERGFNGLTMNVADGSSARLTHYAEFEVGVHGIWRKVEAFVRPFSEENKEDVHLLLGLPWLFTVDAKIKIKDSLIQIGDIEKGEKMIEIRGPKFVESEGHKLVLCQNHKSKEEEVEETESSSDESEDQHSDDDESSDEEDWSGIFNEKEMGK